MWHEKVASKVLQPIKEQTGINVADTATKAFEGDPVDLLNKVLHARPFQTEHDVALRRMDLVYVIQDKT